MLGVHETGSISLPSYSASRLASFGVRARFIMRPHYHQSSPSVACREAMYSLMACQNEAAPGGPISASRLMALLSAASKARCAAGFNFTCSRSSLIRSSAVISLVACSSDDRDKNRNASKHVSRLITDLSSLVCCGHAPASLSGISAQWLGLG